MSDNPIIPIERMQVPSAELSGVNGTNRDPDRARLQISSVNNDLEAIHKFLEAYKDSPNTQRMYTKECERLLLWAIIERRKAFSSLTMDDLAKYFEFLKQPKSPGRWAWPKVDRASKDWRPFNAPRDKDGNPLEAPGLSPASVRVAMSAIDSLLAYLVDAGYLMRNPMRLFRQRSRLAHAPSAQHGSISEGDAIAATHQAIAEGAPRLMVERFLDEDMRNAVYRAIDAMPNETPDDRFNQERTRFMVKFMFLLAPRGGELVRSNMNNFQDLHGCWFWVIARKGGKVKSTALPGEMLQALRRWRLFLGMDPLPGRNDMAPALPSSRDRSKHIKLRRLNYILENLAFKAAAMLEQDPDMAAKADKLRLVSSHWGRHTGITIMGKSGMDKRFMQLDAAHEDIRTTNIYTHEEIEARHREAQKRGTGWK